jgi:hypothetical protein
LVFPSLSFAGFVLAAAAAAAAAAIRRLFTAAAPPILLPRITVAIGEISDKLIGGFF